MIIFTLLWLKPLTRGAVLLPRGLEQGSQILKIKNEIFRKYLIFILFCIKQNPFYNSLYFVSTMIMLQWLWIWTYRLSFCLILISMKTLFMDCILVDFICSRMSSGIKFSPVYVDETFRHDIWIKDREVDSSDDLNERNIKDKWKKKIWCTTKFKS